MTVARHQWLTKHKSEYNAVRKNMLTGTRTNGNTPNAPDVHITVEDFTHVIKCQDFGAAELLEKSMRDLEKKTRMTNDTVDISSRAIC